MEKLITDLRNLLRKVKSLDPKLYKDIRNVFDRMYEEYIEKYGLPKMRGWIDGLGPPRGDGRARRRSPRRRARQKGARRPRRPR